MKNGSRVYTERVSGEDHLFYEITIYNPTTATAPIPAYFSETRTQPLISKPEDYNVAVARFSIPSVAIPTLIAESPTSPTAWYVTLEDVSTGILYSQVVTAPVASNIPQYANYIFSIDEFLYGVNQAFALAFNALIAAHAGVVPAAPFMYWDAATRLFTILATPDYQTGYATYPATPLTPVVKVWMNTSLYNNFQGFTTFLNSYNAIDHRDVQFLFQDEGNNHYTYQFVGSSYAPPPPPAVQWLQNTQDAVSSALSDIKSLLITSGSLPVIGQQISISNGSVPIAPGEMSTFGKSASLPILTDFYPTVDTFISPSATSAFQFNANLYRLVPLTGTQPLARVDFTAIWANHQGVPFQVYIPPGEVFNLLLVFIRKGLPA
jgi:hypothetical protein